MDDATVTGMIPDQHVPVSTSPWGSEAVTVVIITVTVLSLVAFVVAGLMFLGRYRGAQASELQMRVAEAIAGDVECARVDVITAAAIPPSVTLEGVVASVVAHDRAVRIATDATRRLEPHAAVIDRLVVEAERAA
jgi:hypothetical protein